MEQTHWKWVSRVAPRQSRRRNGSTTTGKVGRAVRPLWLDKDAVQAAELSAEAAGVSVTRFIEIMLLEICGASRPVKKSAKKSARGMSKPAARFAQVIRIDRQARR
jgi:hypothetical protein